MGFFSSIFGGGNDPLVQEYINKGAQVVDVRSREEFNGGHAEGAVNIPLDTVQSNLNKIKGYKSVVVCCASGMRSANAASYLKSQGIEVADAGPWQNVPAKK